jgi:hypothetical protein
VDTVELRSGTIEILFSEAVDRSALVRALANGGAELRDETDSATVPITVEQPPITGRNAGRRIVLRPSTAPAAGHSLRLRLAAESIVDTFQKSMASSFELTFPWGTDQVLADAAAPRVLGVRVRNSHLEIEFSEEISTSAAGASLHIDAQPVVWTSSTDRFTLTTAAAVATGTHQLTTANSRTAPATN